MFGIEIKLNSKALQTAVFMVASLLLFLGVSATSAISAADPLYFGEPRQCELYDPVRCPPGTVEDGNFCRPLSSEFCRVFTGNASVTAINFGGESRPVCAASNILGTCSTGDINYVPPSSGGSMSGIPSGFTANVRDLILGFYKDIPNIDRSYVPADRDVWNLLFDGAGDSFNASGEYFIKNSSYKAVACANVDGQARTYLTIPVVMRFTDLMKSTTRWNKFFDKKVLDLGFVLPKPDSNHYCRQIGHSAIIKSPTNESDFKCTGDIGLDNRACYLEVENAGAKNAACMRVIRSLRVEEVKPVFVNEVREFSPGMGSVIYGQILDQDKGYRVLLEAGAADSSLCLQNAKDVFALRSNKGCSDFVSLNATNNTLNTDSGGRYTECVKCLYGDSGQLGELNPTLRVTQGASPIETSPITPYNEPLAIPIPGRLYTDLGGCINASSTGSVVNTIVRVALGVMGGIVILRIIQGALTMQKGDPEGFQEGRDVITSALIGLLLLIFSAALLNFLGINILGLDVATFGS